jgi:predicted PurR-regulated permease PerM
LFSNTLFVIATLFFGLYFLIEENLVDKFLHRYISQERADRLSETLAKAELRMSSWFWGELTLMTVVGVLTYIGLLIIGVKYALPLAVLAGLLEVVPNIGPTISAVPTIIIGFGTSYFTGFSALALAIIVQQLENNLIVPMIMKRAVGLNPILTLLALLLGGRLGGVLGMLLAIPMVLFIETIVQEYLHPMQTKKQNAPDEKTI